MDRVREGPKVKVSDAVCADSHPPALRWLIMSF